MSSSGTLPAANGSVSNPFDAAAGRAQSSAGITLATFFASVVGASIFFGIEFGIFVIIRNKFTRIYQPRTYLVPERERTNHPPPGFWQWMIPVFRTSNSEFIQKCGLDAYFFLRYLRTLLKIFIPLSMVILPVLLPINAIHGRGPGFAVGKYSLNNTLYSNVTGLDQLAWINVRPEKNNRYWAHLVLAVLVVVYTCYIFFDELRGYIRLRQAFLTSPQHRLRASATTVLVSGIPRKWCTFEALDGLYDVFPGGVRNIWINRNYDELNEKVKQRNDIALMLEGAETALIQNVKKAHLKSVKAEAKKSKTKLPKETQLDKKKGKKGVKDQGVAMAETPGLSSGNPHQVLHTLDDALSGPSGEPSTDQPPERKKSLVPIPMLGQGIEVVGHGIDNIGKSVIKGIRQVGKGVDDRLNTTGGFTYEEQSDHRDNYISSNRLDNGNTENDVSPNGLGIENTDTEKTQHPNDASNNKTSHEVSLKDNEKPELPSQNDQHHFGMDGWYDDSRIDQRLARANNPKEPSIAKNQSTGFKFWKPRRRNPFGIPSPTPHGKEDNEFPLSKPSPIAPGTDTQGTCQSEDLETGADVSSCASSQSQNSIVGKSSKKRREYPLAYNEAYDPNDDGEPAWKTYLTEKDRETMRLPIFGWMPALPLIGEKVDKIDFCRKELARLNVEIEHDQLEPEKFPLMNSAFVQFNNQVAAHMACQSVSHHTPNNMAPRIVEISPDDVIWDNMSIKWWESYLRIGVVVVLIVGLIIGWAFPVTFTGLLSQVQYLTETYKWLAWLGKAPTWVLSIIQGLLPQILLAGLLALLPFILRFLAKSQGNRTGMGVELSVQNYYFAFLFVQVFLVVSISSGITTILDKISKGPQSVPAILASNLPKASNYFFSYLTLQALTVSAGALVQVEGLLKWFLWAPYSDNTARQKWARQTSLPDVRWGTFFPVYTNLAAIGLIYSVISPLIMVFNIITFSLFWFVYRYNTLYVTKFRFDTGGLLYPKAINQLFTGLYVMELCLIGLFLLVRDADDRGRAVGTPCKGQAIIMIVLLMFTVIYQVLLNQAFGPLFRYLPITLEDEAVIRDQEFARMQERRWNLDEDENEGDDINDVLAERARRSEEEDKNAEEIELQQIQARKERGSLFLRNLPSSVPGAIGNLSSSSSNVPDTIGNLSSSSSNVPGPIGNLSSSSDSVPGAIGNLGSSSSSVPGAIGNRVRSAPGAISNLASSVPGAIGNRVRSAPGSLGNLVHVKRSWANHPKKKQVHYDSKTDSEIPVPSHHHRSTDPESQLSESNPMSNALFAGINDEIEDLTPIERDRLVQRAFQHDALRAKRPVIWIPRDELGVSDDEIYRTQKVSKHIWISNDYTGLDGRCGVVYRRSPPDFSEIDLIEL